MRSGAVISFTLSRSLKVHSTHLLETRKLADVRDVQPSVAFRVTRGRLQAPVLQHPFDVLLAVVLEKRPREATLAVDLASHLDAHCHAGILPSIRLRELATLDDRKSKT